MNSASSANPERLVVIGLWHLGTVTGACLAELGYQVVGLDDDASVVAQLQKGAPPLFEPGLEDLVRKNEAAGRLSFVSSWDGVFSGSHFVFLSHDTPVNDRDEVDLSGLWTSIKKMAGSLSPNQEIILIVQSQIPIGTCEKFQRYFDDNGARRVRVACLPENLRLGQAIASFMEPDRYVIGADDAETQQRIRTLLQPLKAEPLLSNVKTAEMSKHATNALLAMAICFGNEMSELCEKTGADGMQLTRILLSDRRFQSKLPLRPGLSFSGGTLARDMRILSELGKRTKRPLPLLKSVLPSNEEHRRYLLRRIKSQLKGIRKPTISVLGLTYKAGTSTLRRSLPLAMVKDLIHWGAVVRAHDPKAERSEIPKMKGFTFHSDPYESMKQADAIVFLTDWPEFAKLDYGRAARLVRQPLAIDYKNLFQDGVLASQGFRYVRCGLETAVHA